MPQILTPSDRAPKRFEVRPLRIGPRIHTSPFRIASHVGAIAIVRATVEAIREKRRRIERQDQLGGRFLRLQEERRLARLKRGASEFHPLQPGPQLPPSAKSRARSRRVGPLGLSRIRTCPSGLSPLALEVPRWHRLALALTVGAAVVAIGSRIPGLCRSKVRHSEFRRSPPPPERTRRRTRISNLVGWLRLKRS